MRRVTVGALTALGCAIFLTSSGVSGQGKVDSPGVIAADGSVPALGSYKVPKTPWGEPDLQGTFNARINAELQVSALEETITVTGESPVVDVVSTEQQRVIDREVLDTLPTAGRRDALAVLIPSVDFRSQDVGGAVGVVEGAR